MSVGVASAGAGAAVGDLGAGVREDALERATEGEDDDHDEGRDAGDEQAVLDGGGAAFLHLGEAGVEDDAEVVQHVSSPLKSEVVRGRGDLARQAWSTGPEVCSGEGVEPDSPFGL